MGLTSSTGSDSPIDKAVSSTAEMLAALPEGLMIPAGAPAAERKVTDVLALYRAVFLNSTEPIAIVDSAGRYLEQNVAHEELVGYSSEELRGLTPAIHLGEDAFAGIAAELQRNGVSRREVESRSRDGRTCVIDLSSFAVRDRAGRPVCYVGIAHDITAQRAVEEALRDANRAKSVFLATMSHELRTPLNAIAGYMDLLDAGVHGEMTPAQRDAVRRVQANQRHLLRLIDDVLDFAKLDAGNMQLALTDVPVQETLDRTRVLIEPQFRTKDITFEWAAGDPAVTCHADQSRMQQVLTYLLSNAWKFSPSGGTVTISWDAFDDDVHVHVRDSGPGIPQESLEIVFEPFVQLETGFRRNVEGTGLGLSISRELARGMGGDVVATSVVGQGSTFTLRLPR